MQAETTIKAPPFADGRTRVARRTTRSDAGARDGRLARRAERKWTVTELARAAPVSRSVIDQRFRDVLGLSPIRYLTEWRMHLADELLRTTDLSVSAITRRIGYDSEVAFSRAFRRSHGNAPGAWRLSQQR